MNKSSSSTRKDQLPHPTILASDISVAPVSRQPIALLLSVYMDRVHTPIPCNFIHKIPCPFHDMVSIFRKKFKGFFQTYKPRLSYSSLRSLYYISMCVAKPQVCYVFVFSPTPGQCLSTPAGQWSTPDAPLHLDRLISTGMRAAGTRQRGREVRGQGSGVSARVTGRYRCVG